MDAPLSAPPSGTATPPPVNSLASFLDTTGMTQTRDGDRVDNHNDVVVVYPKSHPAYYDDAGLQRPVRVLRLLTGLSEPGCAAVFRRRHIKAMDAVYPRFCTEFEGLTGRAPSLHRYGAPASSDTLGMSSSHVSHVQAFVVFMLDNVKGLKTNEIYITNLRDLESSFARLPDGSADPDSKFPSLDGGLFDSSDDEDEDGDGAGAGAGAGASPIKKQKKRRRDSDE